jgi:hypothetical protein
MDTEPKYELGLVTTHPLIYAWYEFSCVIRTWLYCRKHGIPCNQWWGVYEKGTEHPIAKFGPMPEAKARAWAYKLSLEQQP